MAFLCNRWAGIAGVVNENLLFRNSIEGHTLHHECGFAAPMNRWSGGRYHAIVLALYIHIPCLPSSRVT